MSSPRQQFIQLLYATFPIANVLLLTMRLFFLLHVLFNDIDLLDYEKMETMLYPIHVESNQLLQSTDYTISTNQTNGMLHMFLIFS